jgi:hypothetical protein
MLYTYAVYFLAQAMSLRIQVSIELSAYRAACYALHSRLWRGPPGWTR